MREPFDNWWKHQMEGFSQEPEPGDWEAIHRRLHPKRRRRFGFWIFPILAVLLLGGGYALYQYFPLEKENTPATSIVMAPNSQASTTAEQAIDNESVSNTQSDVVKATQVGQPKSSQSVIQHVTVAGRHNISISNRTSNNELTTAKNTNLSPLQTTGDQSPAAILENSATSNPPPPIPSAASTTSNDGTAKSGEGIPEIGAAEAMAPSTAATIPTAISDSIAKPGNSKVIARDHLTLSADSISIPTSGRSRRPGQFWANVAVGGIWPQTAPLLQAGRDQASADFTIAPGTSNTILRNTLLGQSGGPAFQAAAYWLKPLGNRLELSMGMGLQYARWNQVSLWFRDSILPSGNMAGSRLAASGEMTMRWWSLQVPIYLQGSWGKKGLGWVAGLQNHFTLSLRQQERLDGSIQTTSGTNTVQLVDRITNTNLTSRIARTYLPQLAVGLYYQHHGRLSWRLQPMVYLPLSNMYLTGSSRGKAYPLQAGLGWHLPLW